MISSRIQLANAPRVPSEIPPLAAEALSGWKGYRTFEKAASLEPGVRIYLVGGVVRDIVSRGAITSKDFDFMLEGEGAEFLVERLAREGSLTRGPFGSPRWYPAGESESYADLIPVDGFNNGLWHCRDIVDVLNQFDFTANAIAVELATGKVFDPQNGIRDAGERVIRAVRFDYPDEPISPRTTLTRLSVLWIRLAHYANALGFLVEPVTARWLLDHAAYEKDAGEFSKLFFSPALSGTA